MRLRLPKHGPLLAVLILVFAFLLAACGSSSSSSTDESQSSEGGATSTAASESSEGTAAMKKLVAAAEKEGKLNLNWGLNNPDMTPLIEAFNAEYPGIEVTDTPNQDQPSNAAKLIQELKAGRPSSTDAFLGVPQLIYALGPKGANALETVDWAALDPSAGKLVDGDGTVLSLFDQITGLTYNTTQISESELPKSPQAVLKMSQPIASTPYAAQFNALATEDALGKEGTLEYLREFEPAGLIGCGDLSRVASGEFAALWMGCGNNIGKIFAAQGAPLDSYVVPGAAITFPWYMGVPKNSAHPEAAKLWSLWLTSPAAQKLLWEREFEDNKLIPGSEMAKEISQYESEGDEFIVADYEFVKANPELFEEQYEGELIAALTRE